MKGWSVLVDLKKTIIACLVIVVFLGIISIASNVFASNSSSNENYVKLSITDPDVTILYDKIEKICEKVRETNFFWPKEKVKMKCQTGQIGMIILCRKCDYYD